MNDFLVTVKTDACVVIGDRMSTTATRKAPIGAGELHDALAETKAQNRLAAAARTTNCSTADLSLDGKHLNLGRVFDAMRERGYQVTDPIKPQAQLRRGFTTWIVKISLPSGETASLAFFTPLTKE